MKHLHNTKSIFGVILTAILACTAVPAYGQKFGSITFSPNTGEGYAWGFSWNYGSRDTARQRAIRECREKGGADCGEIGWFGNTCGALAVTPDGGYGTAYDDTKAAAETKALSMCLRSAGNTNCRIEASQCSMAGGEPESTGFMAKIQQPAKLTREQRRKVQSGLAAEGFNPGPADGIFGNRTREAVKGWQSAKSHTATGVLTDEQARVLITAAQQATARAKQKKAKDLWGSIAFSKDSDGFTWSFVWNSGGREPAREKAIDVCRDEGGTNCAEVGWFRNSCGALALDKSGVRRGYGTAGGETTGEAEAKALSSCRSSGNENCQIEISRCTDGDFETAGAAGQPHIKSLSYQYVISEAIIQCHPDTLLPDADLRWLALQKIKRHMSNHSHIMRRIASTNPALVFTERHIQSPVQFILDSPVRTHRSSK